MGTLILIRHGQSQWNLENRFTGWVDVPLTDAGREEARRGAQLLTGVAIGRAFTSKLQRAQDTLRIILEATGHQGIPIVEDQALNERHYGALQGLDKTETAKKYGEEQVQIWRRSYDVPPPEGESLKDTAARTLPFFRQHILPHVMAGETVLVAAHGNSLRSIIMELDRLSKEEVLSLNLETGAPIMYEIDAQGKVLKKTVHTLRAHPK